MKPPIFSCLSSSLTNNGSIYGRFLFGPLPIDISLTLATILRRSLLHSKIPFTIVSAEIQGASHEYASLPGIQESVLEILLNLGEIVLTTKERNLIGSHFKSAFSSRTFFHDNSVFAFLRISGPCVVTAKDISWPNGIMCVKPDTYIATLSANTTLAMRIKITSTIQNKTSSFTDKGSNLSLNYLSPKDISVNNLSLGTSNNQIPSNLNSASQELNQSFKFSKLKTKPLTSQSKDIFKESSFYNSKEGFGITQRSPLTDLLSESFLQSISIVKKKKTSKTNSNLSFPEAISLDEEKSIKLHNTLNIKNATGAKVILNEKYQKPNLTTNNTYYNLSKFSVFKNLTLVPNSYYYNLQERILKFSSYFLKGERLKATDVFQIKDQTNKNKTEKAFESQGAQWKAQGLNLPGLISKNLQFKNHKESYLDSTKLINLEPLFSKSWGVELAVSSTIYPVEKVNFLIERDDQLEGYRHRIIFEIWTNGSISPRGAIFNSIGSIIKLLYNFREPVKTFSTNA